MAKKLLSLAWKIQTEETNQVHLTVLKKQGMLIMCE